MIRERIINDINGSWLSDLYFMPLHSLLNYSLP